MPTDLIADQWRGIATYRGSTYALTGTIGDFILDMKAYDPTSAGGGATFRLGVLTVDNDNAVLFLRALNAQQMPSGEAVARAKELGSDLIAYIDFDSRRFVHSYYDLPLEDYVPKGWRGSLGDPVEALTHRISARG